jgi:chromosome segregation ATPase
VRRRALARVAVSFFGALSLAACGPDPVAPIAAEIEALKAERVELGAVEKARAEAKEVEQALAAADDALAASRDASGVLAARQAELAAAIAAEETRTAAAMAATLKAGDETRAEAATTARIEGEIASTRERARAVREQAALFAREIRAGDPTWATERRARAASEFLDRAASEYADDPVVQSLASASTGLAPADAAQRAARLRDRLDAVYGVSPEAVGAAPPAEPPAP